MRKLIQQEIIAIKEDQLQLFRVVILTKAGEYNLTNLDGKSYLKYIASSGSKDNRNSTLSLTFEDFRHELKLDYPEIFHANNQVKAYIQTADIWRLVFHGLLGDDTEKVTEHANGDISISQIRDLSKILMDDYIDEATEEYQGWAEEVLQQILIDRFGEGAFPLKVRTSTEFWIESYIPEYTSCWDALQEIADHIGWDLRFKYDNNSNSFRLTFYQPERDPVFYDWEIEENEIDSEKLSSSDADVRNIIRIKNEETDVDVTVQDDESIADLSTTINGISVGGKRYMEISQKETSLIDTEEEATNLANAILYDLSTIPKKTKVVPRKKHCVLWHLEIHDSIQIYNSKQRKDPELLIVDSYSWSAKKGNFSTSLTLSNKVTIGYLRWLQKENRYAKPIDPEELRTGPAANVSNLTLTEDTFITDRGQYQTNIYVDCDVPYNDSRFKDAVVEYKKESDEEYKELGITTNGSATIPGVSIGVRYWVKVTSENFGGVLSSGVEANIYVTGSFTRPPTVENFVVAQNGVNVVFQWDKVNRDDILGYEIREGITWDGGRLIGTDVTGSLYTYDRETNGTKRYMIKAKDTAGNYSAEAAVTIFTVTKTGDDLNVIIERDELAETAGSTNNLYTANGVMKFYCNFSFADFPEISFETAAINLPFSSMPKNNTSGEYVSDVIDTYRICRTGIRIRLEIEATDVNGSLSSFPMKSFADYPNYSFSNPPTAYERELWVQFSDDNVEWTSWQKFVAGQYVFRYCRVKLIISAESETAMIKIQDFTEFFDVPDIELIIDELTISASGTTITFADYSIEFNDIPVRYTANVVFENELRFPVFSEVNQNSVKLRLYNQSGAAVAGIVQNIRIEGY